MNSLYYTKYIKYKYKYLTLKAENNLKKSNMTDKTYPYDFYFVHMMFGTENIIPILKDGIMKPGKDLPERRRHLSKYDPLKYIYANIYFEDLKNLYANNIPFLPSPGLILNPDLIKKQNIIFNKGWFVSPRDDSIYFDKNDTTDVLNKKLNDVKDFLKNPKPLSEYVPYVPIMTHEILFENPIPLKNNLLAITCSGCPSSEITKIKKALKKYGYDHVKLLTDIHIPSLSELLKIKTKN